MSRNSDKSFDESRALGIGRLLLLARRDFIARLARRMSGGGGVPMTRSSGALLPYIDVGGTRSAVLAQRTGISKQAIARAVKELEEAGLLRRKADAEDGRAFLVGFTDKGLRYLKEMHVAIDEIEREYDQMVGADRMAVVRSVLKTIAYPNGK
ncbi:MAG: MarR family winged helix-turn-helix transcriptional regulator [Burkholderiaceae bacterium]